MPVIELKIPNLGESISNVTFSKWLKPDGSIVAMDEPLCEIETEKANQELSADSAGKLIWVAKEGEDLEIGALFAKIDTDAGEPGGSDSQSSSAAKESAPEKKEAPAEKPAAEPVATEPNYASGAPSPAAAKILAEADIKPSEVNGTGRDGRITKEDALKAVDNKSNSPAPAAPEKENAPASPAAPATSFSREERRERLSRMRRTIAKRLVSAKNNTAMLTTFNEVDMSAVMALREKYQEAFVKKYGIKLGFMSIFAKACAKVLLEMPEVNAFIDGDDIIYHEYADISIAISTPTGLVVPPVRNVESLRFSDVELAIKELSGKAREGRLTLEEMSGGTFTITNGGIFGSLMSTPIINEPQSAILGMHAIKERPVAVDGEVKIRPMMYLALSYDHRVIDGATSVTFLVKVKNLIEDPVTLLLDV
ncbi:MAG: 2-oxoglutarate dehydrogenase complex dihydrolipoyllysine-residue succinyltransferase [Saprospiraceae bacterium]|nr:2-oxoglutarate dehydrogenase complex dihydrolipoyllysine-residue succinyltransferase [Saprospiraceae bacterium]MCB9353767.1 2-oxoglutarate dehydrogenase complex dihydrolipoyllysine-residue succinyltransferase [Lewinellaceae bacterium]